MFADYSDFTVAKLPIKFSLNLPSKLMTNNPRELSKFMPE